MVNIVVSTSKIKKASIDKLKYIKEFRQNKINKTLTDYMLPRKLFGIFNLRSLTIEEAEKKLKTPDSIGFSPYDDIMRYYSSTEEFLNFILGVCKDNSIKTIELSERDYNRIFN